MRALVEGFAAPDVQWPRMASEEGAAAFLAQHGLELADLLPPAPAPPAPEQRSASAAEAATPGVDA